MPRNAESQAVLVALRGQVAETLNSLELALAGAVSVAVARSAVARLATGIDTAARAIDLEHRIAWRVLAWSDELASRLVLAECLVELPVSPERAVAVLIEGVHRVDRQLSRVVTSPRAEV